MRISRTGRPGFQGEFAPNNLIHIIMHPVGIGEESDGEGARALWISANCTGRGLIASRPRVLGQGGVPPGDWILGTDVVREVGVVADRVARIEPLDGSAPGEGCSAHRRCPPNQAGFSWSR